MAVKCVKLRGGVGPIAAFASIPTHTSTVALKEKRGVHLLACTAAYFFVHVHLFGVNIFLINTQNARALLEILSFAKVRKS